LAGVTAIDSNTGCPTLSVAEAMIEPEVAVMVALPMPLPVAKPALAIVATAGTVELQFTTPVRFCVLPSL
jgi:hypothetical protein